MPFIFVVSCIMCPDEQNNYDFREIERGLEFTAQGHGADQSRPMQMLTQMQQSC